MEIYLLFVPIYLLQLASAVPESVDKTLVEYYHGQDVTEAVIRRIHRSGVLPHDDKNFLRRLAWVESSFGDDSKTFSPANYSGGIWQVDERHFRTTKKSEGLRHQHQKVYHHFNITWSDVAWLDLLKPMYSGIAASLYIAHIVNKIAPIPDTVPHQSEFWKKYYRHNGVRREFIRKVNILEPQTTCQGLMDICIVLDGSGSISPNDFVSAKRFLITLVESLTLETTRVGLVLYSTEVQEIFDLFNTFTKEEMEQKILSMNQPKKQTNTPGGLDKAVEYFTRARKRPGVPEVIVTFTDGQHNMGSLSEAVKIVRRKNIKSFAVGIGNGIRQTELTTIAVNDTSRVFQVNNFDSLGNVLYRLTSETCEVPQELDFNDAEKYWLEDGKRRNYKLDLPSDGITVTIAESSGSVTGWYSYSEEVPNSAVHDGVIVDGAFYINNPDTTAPTRISKRSTFTQPGKWVYLTIQGNSFGKFTNFTLTVAEGYNIIDPVTEPLTFVYALQPLLGLRPFRLNSNDDDENDDDENDDRVGQPIITSISKHLDNFAPPPNDEASTPTPTQGIIVTATINTNEGRIPSEIIISGRHAYLLDDLDEASSSGDHVFKYFSPICFVLFILIQILD